MAPPVEDDPLKFWSASVIRAWVNTASAFSAGTTSALSATRRGTLTDLRGGPKLRPRPHKGSLQCFSRSRSWSGGVLPFPQESHAALGPRIKNPTAILTNFHTEWQKITNGIKAVWYSLHRPRNRHCHLYVSECFIVNIWVVNLTLELWNLFWRVKWCIYYLFICNLCCLVNIQQHCHNSSHCDWRHHI